MTNKKFWDGLPADIRGQLEKAMADATAFGNGIAGKENSDALEEMRKSGKTQIVTLTAAEKAALKKAMQPVYDDAAARVGKETLEEFEKVVQGAATN